MIPPWRPVNTSIVPPLCLTTTALRASSASSATGPRVLPHAGFNTSPHPAHLIRTSPRRHHRLSFSCAPSAAALFSRLRASRRRPIIVIFGACPCGCAVLLSTAACPRGCGASRSSWPHAPCGGGVSRLKRCAHARRWRSFYFAPSYFACFAGYSSRLRAFTAAASCTKLRAPAGSGSSHLHRAPQRRRHFKCLHLLATRPCGGGIRIICCAPSAAASSLCTVTRGAAITMRPTSAS